MTGLMAVGALISAPVAITEASAPGWTAASSGSCVVMTANPNGGYDLVNSCSVCRTAIVSWCDGDGHMFDVRANRTVHIDACRGMQALLSDVACEHDH